MFCYFALIYVVGPQLIVKILKYKTQGTKFITALNTSKLHTILREYCLSVSDKKRTVFKKQLGSQYIPSTETT